MYDSLKLLAEVAGFAAVGDMNNNKLFTQFWSATLNRGWGEEQENIYHALAHRYDLGELGFNAGVMAFPTSLITPKLREELFRLCEQYLPIVITGEQPILNLLFYKNWQELTHHYNFFIPLPPPLLTPENVKAAIVHFAGKAVKPWNKESPFHADWLSNRNAAESIRLS